MPKFQRVPCCSLRLWEPAPDPAGRDGSLGLLWHCQSGVCGGQPRPQLCACVQPLQGNRPPPQALGIVYLEKTDSCGQEPPQHQVRLLQGRGTYSEPISVETGGPGTTDHVTAQASTKQTDPFDNAEARPTGPSLHPPFHTLGKARGFQAAPEKTGTDLGSLCSPVVCQLQSQLKLSIAEFCTEPSREVRGRSCVQTGFSLQHHMPRGVARATPASGIFSEDAGDMVALH